MTLQSTINYSAYYNSDEEYVERDPNSDPLVATHTSDVKKRKVTDTDTTNIKYPQTLLINRLIPEIIPVIILPINPPIAYGVEASRGTLHAHEMITLKEIFMDAAYSGAHIFRDPTVVNWKDTDRKITRDGNTSRRPTRLTYTVCIGGGPSVSPSRTGTQYIDSPSRSIGPVEVSNSQSLHTSINGISSKHRYLAPTFSKLICRKLSSESSADVYSRFRMNFTHDAVLTESQNFMNLGLSSVHASDELGSFRIPTTRIRRAIDGSNCLLSGHIIGGVTKDRIIRTRSEKNIVPKMILKLRGKSRFWAPKIVLLVDHLWTRLLLVQTRPTKQLRQVNQFQFIHQQYQ